MNALRALIEQALRALDQVEDESSLEGWRTEYLGRNGALTQHMRSIGQLGADERPAAGQAANAAKVQIESAYAERKAHIDEFSLDRQLEAERIDVTLPARKLHAGGLHPITYTLRRILDIFRNLLSELVSAGGITPICREKWHYCFHDFRSDPRRGIVIEVVNPLTVHFCCAGSR